MEDAARVTLLGNVFNQTGGNAVMLSNNVVDTEVLKNEFVYIGDSAIAALGSTDRTDPPF